MLKSGFDYFEKGSYVMNNTIPKRKTTFIGIILIAYFALISCENTQLNTYGGFIVLVGSIIADNLLSKERLKVHFPTSCKMLYYFVIYCFFSRLWAMNPAIVTDLSKQMIAVLLLVSIPSNYFIKIKNPSIIIAAVACIGVAVAGYVIFKEGGLSAYYERAKIEGERIGEEVNNVNSIGIQTSIATVILVFYGLFKRKFWCLLPAVLTFLVSAGTGSKKTIIILAVGLFLLMLLSQKDKQAVVKFFKIVMWVIAGFIALRLILSLDIMSTVKERFDGFFAVFRGDSYSSDGSSEARWNMAKVGWEKFKEDPYIGIGLGNSKEYRWQTSGIYGYFHMDYIEQLVNGGLVGFLLYYGNLVYIFTRHIKLMRIKKDPEIVLSFITLVIYFILCATCVTYYDSLGLTIYFILWITTIEVKKAEYEQIEKHSEEGEEVNCSA